jgi:hypothetical protein
MNALKTLLGKAGLGRLSAGEYQANLSGLNMFFGAVLGLVLAGTEALNDIQFGFVLLGLASVVITILYISSSKRRTSYSGLALLYAVLFPELMEVILRTPHAVPGKIRPTLIVWVLLTMLVEFWAREKGQEPRA